MMDFFDRADYKFNKALMSTVGLWPYDMLTKRKRILVVWIIVAGSQFIAKITGIISLYPDLTRILESVPPIIVDIMAAMKLITCVVQSEKLLELLEQIKRDWSTLEEAEQTTVLRKYTDDGRIIIMIYAGYLYFAMILFLILPFVPNILHLSNETDPHPIPHIVDYYIDPDKYYLLMLIHSYVQIVMAVSVYVAVDTLIILFVSHSCGMFATIGYQLERMTDEDVLAIDTHPPVKDDKPYMIVGQCIKMHISTLRFASLMEDAFNICFLLQAGFNMFIMSFSALQAMASVNNPLEFVRQMAFAYAELFHLTFESYQGQQLVDHSARIHEHLISSPWYLTSARTKTLVSFMIVRSQFPCQLTAGKLFVIGMESCSAILRMSVSYFMMLRTFE